MFFLGRINGVLNKKLHGLPAADELSAATMQDFYDVAACITFVNLQLLSHY
jgi:hypothetical protein